MSVLNLDNIYCASSNPCLPVISVVQDVFSLTVCLLLWVQPDISRVVHIKWSNIHNRKGMTNSGIKCDRKVQKYRWSSFRSQTECLASCCLMLLMLQLQLEAGCSFMTAHHDDWQVLGWGFDHLSLWLKTHYWLKVKSCTWLLSFQILTCLVQHICSHQRQDKKCHNGELFQIKGVSKVRYDCVHWWGNVLNLSNICTFIEQCWSLNWSRLRFSNVAWESTS